MLISSGALTPCHSDRWNSGAGAPSTADATTVTSGPAITIGARPTAMQTATSRITGAFMPSGGSCGCGFGRSFGGPLKNVSCTRRSEYATENTLASVASTGTAQPAAPHSRAGARTASSSIISLLMKPLNGAMPAIAALASSTSVPIIGIIAIRPPSLRMSRVCVSWSMMPALMNRAALKLAWFRMWNTAATADIGEARPIRKVIRPRWLTVE